MNDQLKLPESSPEHKEKLAQLKEAKEQLAKQQEKVEELSRQEMKLRPICPRCKSKVGTGTIKVLAGGGDYEDWPCSLCQFPEYDRCGRGY